MRRVTVDWQSEQSTGEDVVSGEDWSRYTLSDGTTMKMKTLVTRVVRLDKRKPDGEPVYCERPWRRLASRSGATRGSRCEPCRQLCEEQRWRLRWSDGGASLRVTGWLPARREDSRRSRLLPEPARCRHRTAHTGATFFSLIGPARRYAPCRGRTDLPSLRPRAVRWHAGGAMLLTGGTGSLVVAHLADPIVAAPSHVSRLACRAPHQHTRPGDNADR